MANKSEKNINGIVGKLYNKVIKPKDTKKNHKEKNLILFVGNIYGHMIDAWKSYEKETNKKYRLGLLYDTKAKLKVTTKEALNRLDLVLECDTSSDTAVQKTLMPYQEEIVAVTLRSEDKVATFARIVPHLPYIYTPTSRSLLWAGDKVQLRERLETYDPKISPLFMVVEDVQKQTIKAVEESVGYPLIVKPSGLQASRLVSICYHREELEEVLKKVFKKINVVHKEIDKKDMTPRVLVEQFMEGEMYSVDAYVNHEGKVYFCPLVHIKTGKDIGFDDFFGYRQITPVLLKEAEQVHARVVAQEAVYALGLRNTTAHIELMKTEQGWKVVEVGPRIGGFRHMMYEFSYGINHTANDILIRLDKKPSIPKKVKGYTVAMKFFAKNEGKLKKLTGIKKAQELASFKRIYINKVVGDNCLYAKHGGSSVFDIIMFNEDRSELLADIRRLEQSIEIETE